MKEWRGNPIDITYLRQIHKSIAYLTSEVPVKMTLQEKKNPTKPTNQNKL